MNDTYNSEYNDSLENILHGLLFRASCPSAETLLQYQLQRLRGPEQQTVAGHLSDCPHCQRDVVVIGSAAADRASAHADWQARIRRWLNGLVERADQLIAAELGMSDAAFAVKGSADETQTAPRIYTGGAWRISLSVQKNGLDQNGSRLEGSVLNTEDPVALLEGTVFITDAETVTESIALDDFGFFKFDALKAGMYTLLFVLPDRSIWIESLSID